MKNPCFALALRCVIGLCAVAALGSCGGGGAGGNGSGEFVFSTHADDRYVRIDRMGQPALATALLSRSSADPVADANGAVVNPDAANRFNNFVNQRDAFNRGDPINDPRDFSFMLTQGPQINSLANIHFKLGRQLRELRFTPCSRETVTPPAGIAQINLATCLAQIGSSMLPDMVNFDPNVVASWPNGRTFDDPVIDRFLAAALLDISSVPPPHHINALVGVINPSRDDTGTLSPVNFPHMRAAHPFP